MDRVRRMQVWSTVLSASLTSLAARADAGHPCAAIVADTQRLACYDAAFGSPAKSRASSDGPWRAVCG